MICTEGGGDMKGKGYWRWGLTAFLTVCAILVFYDAFYQGGTLQQILGKLAQVLAPVFYGLAMAYLLTPLVKWFERGILWCVSKLRKQLPDKPLKHGKGLLRAGAILLTWAVVLALTYWLMSVLIPQLVESVTMLINNARYYYTKVYRWTDNWLKENPEIGSWANDVLSEYYNNGLKNLTDTILPKAQELAEQGRVCVVDSRQLSTGGGLLALQGAKLRDDGMAAPDIAAELRRLAPLSDTSFVLDTLEYMWKGGRCSGVTALGANMLKLKPSLEIRDGKLVVCKKYRGAMEKVYRQYITERLADKTVVADHAFITHSGEVAEGTLQELTKLVRELAPFQEVFVTQAGCTVSSHCGPGTLGVLFLRQPEQ